MSNVLIVDDSETVRVQLRNDLAKEGHTTFEACNGKAGLQMLEENVHHIDLIFCDVNMPEMDGLSMCREIHKNDILKSIPIFMLTTQTSQEMKSIGKDLGVVAWVIKPYEKKKLMNGVAKVLAQTGCT
ncbi:MAG: response regulator receiver [Proteobacteria bacterium]|nr:response regulator receiver [Pseudomonadota bacterium]